METWQPEIPTAISSDSEDDIVSSSSSLEDEDFYGQAEPRIVFFILESLSQQSIIGDESTMQSH